MELLCVETCNPTQILKGSDRTQLLQKKLFVTRTGGELTDVGGAPSRPHAQTSIPSNHVRIVCCMARPARHQDQGIITLYVSAYRSTRGTHIMHVTALVHAHRDLTRADLPSRVPISALHSASKPRTSASRCVAPDPASKGKRSGSKTHLESKHGK